MSFWVRESNARLKLGLTKDRLQALTAAHVERFGDQRGGVIAEFSRKRVRRIVAAGVKDGLTTGEIADVLRTKFGAWSESRARTIAITEVQRSANWGLWNMLQQAGVEERRWLSVRDGKVRDSHRRLDGQVRAIDEPFKIGSDSAMYPGGFSSAANCVNCRCYVVPAKRRDDTDLDAQWRAFIDDAEPWVAQASSDLRKMFAAQRARALDAL